ncbi:hypothetical protein DPSP01_007085 [Paraphaeosphaeria sporulosa]
MTAPPPAVALLTLPKVVSSPAYPNALPFLTSLPAELETMIYQILFSAEEPITLAERQFDENEKHKLHPVMPCLRTYRQIYSEAISILYIDNTWMFTRPSNFCDQDCHPTDCISTWIEEVESNMNLIKRVIVDVGRTCPSRCRRSVSIYDMILLAKMDWTNARQAGEDIEFEITFEDRGGHLGDPLHRDIAPSLSPLSEADFLNNVFRSLVIENSLYLFQYNRFEKVLDTVKLDVLAQCCVAYKTLFRNSSSEEKVKIDLHLLFQRAFLALTDSFFASPTMKYHPKLDIWINGMD